jgi:hypothetical protein
MAFESGLTNSQEELLLTRNVDVLRRAAEMCCKFGRHDLAEAFAALADEIDEDEKSNG